jgi:hypothetical protein
MRLQVALRSNADTLSLSSGTRSRDPTGLRGSSPISYCYYNEEPDYCCIGTAAYALIIEGERRTFYGLYGPRPVRPDYWLSQCQKRGVVRTPDHAMMTSFRAALPHILLGLGLVRVIPPRHGAYKALQYV